MDEQPTDAGLPAEHLAPPPRKVGVFLGLACFFEGCAPSCSWLMLFFGLGAVYGAADALPDLDGIEFAVTIVAIVLWGLITVFGVAFVVHSWRQGLLAIRLLRHGRLATANIKRHKAINVRTWDIVVEVVDDDGTPLEITVGVSGEDALDLDKPRRVLYDPADPTRAMNFDQMRGEPQLDGKGGFRRPPLPGLLGSLVLPLLTLIFLVRVVAMRLVGWIAR